MGEKAVPGYDQLLRRVATLDPAYQLRLLSDLVAMPRQRMEQSPAGNAIAELRGLGKDICTESMRRSMLNVGVRRGVGR